MCARACVALAVHVVVAKPPHVCHDNDFKGVEPGCPVLGLSVLILGQDTKEDVYVRMNY